MPEPLPEPWAAREWQPACAPCLPRGASTQSRAGPFGCRWPALPAGKAHWRNSPETCPSQGHRARTPSADWRGTPRRHQPAPPPSRPQMAATRWSGLSSARPTTTVSSRRAGRRWRLCPLTATQTRGRWAHTSGACGSGSCPRPAGAPSHPARPWPGATPAQLPA